MSKKMMKFSKEILVGIDPDDGLLFLAADLEQAAELSDNSRVARYQLIEEGIAELVPAVFHVATKKEKKGKRK